MIGKNEDTVRFPVPNYPSVWFSFDLDDFAINKLIHSIVLNALPLWLKERYLSFSFNYMIIMSSSLSWATSTASYVFSNKILLAKESELDDKISLFCLIIF